MQTIPTNAKGRASLAFPTLSLLALCLVAGLSSAWAESGQDLIEQLSGYREAGREADLETAIGEVPTAYKSNGPAVQGKLRAELGKIAKNKKFSSARIAAMDALTKLDDPKNAWKVVSKFLPKPKVEAASDFDIAVVRAAGRLAQSKAAKPLLDLVTKAKDPKLAAAAAQALGGFHEDAKSRVKILGELVPLGKRLKPGQAAGSKAISPAAQKRWEVLGPALLAGLNELTGREVASFEDWVQLWEANKKKLKSLFPSAD